MISLKVLNIFYLNYNLRSAGLQSVRIWVRFWRRLCLLKCLHNGAGGIPGLRGAYESCMSRYARLRPRAYTLALRLRPRTKKRIEGAKSISSKIRLCKDKKLVVKF